MSRLLAFLLCALSGATLLAAEPYPDRFVWVFGWNLSKDSDVQDIGKLLETASQHHLNGAVLSAGLDALDRQNPDYFRRLQQVQADCQRLNVELIPSLFSVGYGAGALGANRMLAEGLPVTDAPFLVKGNEARLLPDPAVTIANGDFERFQGNAFADFKFHDQPGKVTFPDTQVKHGGNASMRFEGFGQNPNGHGRVMQEVRLRPNRCYRVSVWVKTEDLQPTTGFQILARQNNRDIAPRKFNLPSTTDWRKISLLINPSSPDPINLYAGMWGGKQGKLWLDDFSIEEIGPLNVLRRPGTPVTVRSEDGKTTYTEGKDYAPLEDPKFGFTAIDREAPPLKILPGSGIRDGQKLLVSWYHPMVIYDGQVTMCMAEPELYEIYDREARKLAETLHPKRVLLNMDEIRMGGTCQACKGKNMAELLGQCITRQVELLRKYIPGVQIYIWSDMLDPNHNAKDNYFLVQGSFANSWKHVPKDMTIAVWGGGPRPKSLRFFADEGFPTLAACYYDADNLKDVQAWIDLAKDVKNVRGFMYTPWTKKYQLLADFGDMVNAAKGQ